MPFRTSVEVAGLRGTPPLRQRRGQRAAHRRRAPRGRHRLSAADVSAGESVLRRDRRLRRRCARGARDARVSPSRRQSRPRWPWPRAGVTPRSPADAPITLPERSAADAEESRPMNTPVPLRIAVALRSRTRTRSYVHALKAMPGLELVAADPDGAAAADDALRGAALAAELGVAYVDTYDEAFAWKPDAVVIAAENSRHRALVERAAAAGCARAVREAAGHHGRGCRRDAGGLRACRRDPHGRLPCALRAERARTRSPSCAAVASGRSSASPASTMGSSRRTAPVHRPGTGRRRRAGRPRRALRQTCSTSSWASGPSRCAPCRTASCTPSASS